MNVLLLLLLSLLLIFFAWSNNINSCCLKNIDEVITGYDLAHASTEKIKQSALAYHVFARVTPEQKYALIKALEQDNNVGFLGEGVNDVPALQAAHVAIVVDNATDVAKDAADIVLLKKSLHVIVQGIKEGRTILTNTLKYLKVTLSSNFSNFYTIAFVSLIIDTLPMLPLQILLVNLLSDFPLIAIATDKVDHDELTQPKTYHIRELLLMATFFGLCSSVFDLIFFSVFYDRAPEVLQTNWFVFSILTELFFFFSIRTKRFFLWGHRPSLTIITLAGISITLTIALPFTHTGRSLFSFITPSLHQMEWLVLIVISYFITIECIKLLYYRFSFSSKPTPSPLP